MEFLVKKCNMKKVLIGLFIISVITQGCKEKEQLPKAALMAKHANELQPNNASFEDTYAWVLFKMGNYEQALIWIELALTHSETQTATLMEHYGDILYFLTKKDAAVQAIEKWKAAKTLGAGSEQLSEKIKEGKWIE